MLSLDGPRSRSSYRFAISSSVSDRLFTSARFLRECVALQDGHLDFLVWVTQKGKTPELGAKPVNVSFDPKFFSTSSYYPEISKARRPFILWPTIPFLATRAVSMESLTSDPGELTGFPLRWVPNEPSLSTSVEGK